MKINFVFTDNEINESIDMIAETGASHNYIMDMINDFKITGTNLKMLYSSHNKNLSVEINENIIVKIFNKLKPMISMIKSIVRTIVGFADDLDEYFDDVKVVDSWSKRNKENTDELVKRLMEENKKLKTELRASRLDTFNKEKIRVEKIETNTELSEFARDFQNLIFSKDKMSEEELESDLMEAERHDRESKDEEEMALLQAEEEEFFRSIESE